MPIAHFCLSCSKTFDTVAGLKSHAKAKRHKSNPYICDACDVSFVSLTALQSHMNSPRHESDYSSTRRAKAYKAYCNGCERHFVSSAALNNHLAHSRKHNWCFDCSRGFASTNSLAQHRRSHAHHGRKCVCPLCRSKFKSPSAIAMHIESGVHGFTRHHVTAAVQRMQIVPAISIKRIEDVRLPPTVLYTYVATPAFFTGTAYQCFLCPRRCRTLTALNDHLNSPAHDDNEFRCPRCKKGFKLVSGFVQHLESGACGLAKAGQVQKYFEKLTGNFSRLLTM